ncbi:hypothetical protein OAF54_02235 [bacterium]|nr:hypothetical protein [bacterium]
MAISYSTNAADKRMVQWWSGDTLAGWGGPNDGLDGFGAEIEGTSCVVIAARKNENLSITYTSTLTSVPAGSQLIFNNHTVIGVVLNSLDIDVDDGASGTANFDILPEFTASDSSLNFKSFVAIAMDLSAGTLNAPVNNLSGISYNIDVQNINIRATDNFFLDCASVGDGVTLNGTTVSDTLFTEAQAYDISNDDHFGVLLAYEGIIFAQGDVDIDTTTGNSTAESLTFIETLNGSNDYELNGTGTAVFNGTNIQSTGTVTCIVNMSNMTSFTMTAGSMNNIDTITFGSNNTINRANFNNITTLSTGGSTFNNNTLNTVTTANISTLTSSGCIYNSVATPNITSALSTSAFNECGEVDISTGGGTLTTCSFTNSTAAIGLTVADLNDIDDLTFTGDNTSHAVDVGTISAGTVRSWNHTVVSGYAATNQASNATSTAGDSEVILVNVNTGITLTINVTAGATIPTYRNTGPGTVVIQQVVNFDITNIYSGTELRLFTDPALGALGGAEDVANVASYSAGFSQLSGPDAQDRYNVRYQYNYTADTDIFVVVHSLQYQYLRLETTLVSNDTGLQINQNFDRQYENP